MTAFYADQRQQQFKSSWHVAASNSTATNVTPFSDDLIRIDASAQLVDHRIAGSIVYPAAGFCMLGIEMQRLVQRNRSSEKRVTLSNLKFSRALTLNTEDPVTLIRRYRPVSNEFSLDSYLLNHSQQSIQHAKGQFGSETSLNAESAAPRSLSLRCAAAVNVADFYRRLRDVELDYGAFFQRINWIRRSTLVPEAITHLTFNPDLTSPEARATQFVAMLDGAFQSLAAALHVECFELYVPSRIARLDVFGEIQSDCLCYARVTKTNARIVDGHISILSSDGAPLIEIRGLRCLKLSPEKMGSSRRPASLEIRDLALFADQQRLAP